MDIYNSNDFKPKYYRLYERFYNWLINHSGNFTSAIDYYQVNEAEIYRDIKFKKENYMNPENRDIFHNFIILCLKYDLSKSPLFHNLKFMGFTSDSKLSINISYSFSNERVFYLDWKEQVSLSVRANHKGNLLIQSNYGFSQGVVISETREDIQLHITKTLLSDILKTVQEERNFIINRKKNRKIIEKGIEDFSKKLCEDFAHYPSVMKLNLPVSYEIHAEDLIFEKLKEVELPFSIIIGEFRLDMSNKFCTKDINDHINEDLIAYLEKENLKRNIKRENKISLKTERI